MICHSVQFSSVQSLSRVRLFATTWITAPQDSLPITNYWSSLKLVSIKAVMPSSISSSVIPFSSCPQSLPASGSFPMINSSHEVAKVLEFQLQHVFPVNTQGWSPFEWTGWLSLQFKGLLRVFSNTTLQKHQFFSTQLSSESTLTSIDDYWKNHSFD